MSLCPQLLLAVCEKNSVIGTSCQGAMLPSITNVINLADSHDRAAFAMATHIKQEPRERENSETKEEVSPKRSPASSKSHPTVNTATSLSPSTLLPPPPLPSRCRAHQ